MDTLSLECLKLVFAYSALFAADPPTVRDFHPKLQPGPGAYYLLPLIVMDEGVSYAEEEELNKLGDNIHGFRTQVVVLMLVCRRWRQVCVETSQLWDMVYVTRASVFADVRAYLKRSHGLPVDVIFDFSDSAGAVSPVSPLHGEEEMVCDLVVADAVRFAMDLLDECFSSCRTLSISLVNPAEMAFVLRCLCSMKITCCVLEQLRLTYMGKEQIDPFRVTAGNFFSHVASLRHIRVDGVPFFVESLSKSNIMENITVLVIRSSETERLEWRSLIAVLRASPRLEWLTLFHIDCAPPTHHLGPGVGEHVQPLLVALPLLRALYIGFVPSAFAVGVLDALELQNLSELVLDFDHIPCESLCERLIRDGDVRYGGRSILSNLRMFACIGLPVSAAIARGIVGRLIVVERLIIRHSGDFFGVLEEMAVEGLANQSGAQSSLQPLPCPKLTQLMTGGVKGLSVGLFVLSRALIGCRLHKVDVDHRDVRAMELWLIHRFVAEVSVNSRLAF